MYIQPIQVCYILKVVLASPESHSVLSMCVERSAYVSFLSYKLKQSLLKVWTLGRREEAQDTGSHCYRQNLPSCFLYIV